MGGKGNTLKSSNETTQNIALGMGSELICNSLLEAGKSYTEEIFPVRPSH